MTVLFEIIVLETLYVPPSRTVNSQTILSSLLVPSKNSLVFYIFLILIYLVLKSFDQSFCYLQSIVSLTAGTL